MEADRLQFPKLSSIQRLFQVLDCARAQTIQAIIKRHRKILIFTSPVVRTRIADEAAQAGIPGTNLLASILTADKIEAVEAFEKAEEGVLVYQETIPNRCN